MRTHEQERHETSNHAHNAGLTDLKFEKNGCKGVQLDSSVREDSVHPSERPWNEAKDSQDDAPKQFPGVCLHLKNQLSVDGNFPQDRKSTEPPPGWRLLNLATFSINNETTQYRPYHSPTLYTLRVPATPLCYFCSSTLTWTKLTRTTPPHTAPAFPTRCVTTCLLATVATTTHLGH